MRFDDAFRASFAALRHSRVRTFLTMLGIVIGIVSVILLMAIGTSAQALIINQVQGIGSNLVFVIPGGSSSSRFASPASVQGIIIKTLVQSDVDRLSQDASIARVAPQVNGQAKVVYGNNDSTVSYTGVTADFFPMRNFSMSKGYPFTSDDVASFNRVAVLGPQIAKTLFGGASPIGQSVRLRDSTFRVVGVLDSKGVGPFGVDQDNLMIIPISVAQKQLLGIDYFNSITIQVNNNYNVDYAKERITTILRENHSITDPAKDDFTVRTQEDALSLLGSITSILTIFLTAIASISLVVGGIGIMNIMMVSVTERTREIGLRKAVGATNRDILTQFLFEAMMLTLIGGFVGITIGALFTGLTYLILSHVVAGWTFSFPISAIILAVTVSTVTGIVFGLYPARQAAQKNPIEALRYE